MGNVDEWVQGGAPGISADRLNEPFHIRSVVYLTTPSRLEITVGPGRADFGVPGMGVSGVVEKASASVVTVSSPSTNTTYYVFVQRGGTFRTSTSPILGANEARIGSVATGASLPTLTRDDLRGFLPVALPGVYPLKRFSNPTGDITFYPSQAYAHLLMIATAKLNTTGWPNWPMTVNGVSGSYGNVYIDWRVGGAWPGVQVTETKSTWAWHYMLEGPPSNLGEWGSIIAIFPFYSRSGVSKTYIRLTNTVTWNQYDIYQGHLDMGGVYLMDPITQMWIGNSGNWLTPGSCIDFYGLGTPETNP